MTRYSPAGRNASHSASIDRRPARAKIATPIIGPRIVNDVRRSAREGVSVAIDELAPVLTIQSNAIATLQLRDLERAMGKLPQEQREVILLVGLEGMSYDEVAAILKVPIGTVRSRLSRGRDLLRRLMDMEEAPPRLADRER